MSEAIEPIVYYVDSGVPEPISSALVEGASWWNQAFEAAGFIDGFQVKDFARWRRPHGCALQRDSVGASVNSGLVVWHECARP